MANGPTTKELGVVTEQHGRDIVSIRDYFDSRFSDFKVYVGEKFELQDKAVGAALAAADRAVLKAELATDKRFEAVNEFRQTLSDQTNTFLARPEYDAQHKALEDKVSDLSDRINRIDAVKEGSTITMAKIYTAIGAVGAILAIVVLLANNVFK